MKKGYKDFKLLDLFTVTAIIGLHVVTSISIISPGKQSL